MLGCCHRLRWESVESGHVRGERLPGVEDGQAKRRQDWTTRGRRRRVPAQNSAAPDRRCSQKVVRTAGDDVRSPQDVGSITAVDKTIAPRVAHVFAGQSTSGRARTAATMAMTGIGHGAATPDPSPTARWTGTLPGKRRPKGSSGHSGCLTETAVETATVAAKSEAAPTIAVSLMAPPAEESDVDAPLPAGNLADGHDVKDFDELSLYGP
jgi:hypothetical protein